MRYCGRAPHTATAASAGRPWVGGGHAYLPTAAGLTEVDLGGAEAQPILTEPRAKALSDAVTAFLPLFKDWNRPADVEWVIEGDTVWIVQARPFVE